MNGYLWNITKEFCKQSSTIIRYEPDYEKFNKFIVLRDGTMIPCKKFPEEIINQIKESKLVPGFNRYECLCFSGISIYMYHENKNEMKPNKQQLVTCYDTLVQITSAKHAERYVEQYIVRHLSSYVKVLKAPIRNIRTIRQYEMRRVLGFDHENPDHCIEGILMGYFSVGGRRFLVDVPSEGWKEHLCNLVCIFPENQIYSSL